MNSIMNEIEMELMQSEDEQHLQMVEMETEDLVERHSTTCLLCGQRSTDGMLCSVCRNNMHQQL